MNRTKHDLSYNSTKLDYQAMLATAESAFAQLREAAYRELSELQKYPLEGCFHLHAEWLERYAKQLTVVAETMYTLRGGLERQEVEIVNKAWRLPS